MARNTLGLTLEGSITYPMFNKANGLFWGLIKALSGEIAQEQKLIWWPAELHRDATLIRLGAETSPTEGAERTIYAYANVGTALAFATPIPYSPKVNRSALALSQVLNGEVTGLHFTTELGSIPVTQPVGSKHPRKRTQAWGTVDGMLETITSHRRLAFTLYESHFGFGVQCTIRHEQEALMLEHWRQLVRVSGWVIRDAQSGQPIEIQEISDVRPLSVSEPDAYHNAAGILDLQGEAPEDLIRKLRHAPA